MRNPFLREKVEARKPEREAWGSGKYARAEKPKAERPKSKVAEWTPLVSVVVTALSLSYAIWSGNVQRDREDRLTQRAMELEHYRKLAPLLATLNEQIDGMRNNETALNTIIRADGTRNEIPKWISGRDFVSDLIREIYDLEASFTKLSMSIRERSLFLPTSMAEALNGFISLYRFKLYLLTLLRLHLIAYRKVHVYGHASVELRALGTFIFNRVQEEPLEASGIDEEYQYTLKLKVSGVSKSERSKEVFKGAAASFYLDWSQVGKESASLANLIRKRIGVTNP